MSFESHWVAIDPGALSVAAAASVKGRRGDPSFVVQATGIAAIGQPGRLHCDLGGDEWLQDDSGAYSAVTTLTFSGAGTIELDCGTIFAGPIYLSSNQLVAIRVDAIN